MALKPEGEEICPEAGGDGTARSAPHGTTPIAAVVESEDALNLNPSTLEEALKTIRKLQERQATAGNHKKGSASTQASQQLLVWRRRALAYEEALGRMGSASQEQLQRLSGQLMLLQARLLRKQKDIGRMLSQREAVILRQQRVIQHLQARLQEAGLDMAHGDLDSPTGETNLDSLNDSDSAVIMEDGPGSDYEHSAFPRFRHLVEGSTVTVVRSISDAVEAHSAKWRQQQYSSQPQRGNCFLRRPEVLETVYSVEEDGEGDGVASTSVGAPASTATTTTSADSGAMSVRDDSPVSQDASDGQPQSRRTSQQSYTAGSNSSIDDTPSADDSSYSTATGRQSVLQYGSLEILTDSSGVAGVGVNGGHQATPGNQVTTYNRVMSNHRSVTKPKDVKYKRINKAKSKSLEELRGRLRNWVDKGITSNKFISLDQSYA